MHTTYYRPNANRLQQRLRHCSNLFAKVTTKLLQLLLKKVAYYVLTYYLSAYYAYCSL